MLKDRSRIFVLAALVTLAAATGAAVAVSFATAADVAGALAPGASAPGAAQTPVILSPAPGAYVRGVFVVEATTPARIAADPPAEEATPVAALALDGTLVATTTPPWRFTIDSAQMAPGPHTLGVRVVEPTTSAEATRVVNVDNVAPRLSAITRVVRILAGRAATATVSWKISDPVTTTAGVSIRVLSARSVVRRAYTRTWATPRGRIVRWTWDGKDHRGSAVPRGAYTISVSTTDAAGNRRASAATSTVVVGRYVVVIDAGHQAVADPRPEPIGPGSKVTKPRVAGGATGVVSRMPESRITLAIALRLERLLKARGFTVVMVRRTQDVHIANGERARIANRARADLFVRIHLDGVSDTKVTGTSMLYPATNKWTRPIAARSKAAAIVVQRALSKMLGLPDRGLSARGDMSGFNWCTVPVILPEVAFLSNPRDDRLLSSAVGQAKAARGLADGVSAYLSGAR